MQIGPLKIEKPLALAPMAGVTDAPFRLLCAGQGAGFTVTEMISSRALVYQDAKTLALLRLFPGEAPAAAQIFGNDPAVMAAAARKALEVSGAGAVDINMGCPMPKIVNNGDGSALMDSPELACAIVSAVKDAVSGAPVTVKLRLGRDRGSLNAPRLAAALAAAGADALTIHGRTRVQMYSGRADWEAVALVKRAVSIPVFANGDVSSPEAALKCLRVTGADGLMIGRAAFGDPWIFARVSAALEGREIPPEPPLEEKLDCAARQLELCREYFGERLACLVMRKHLAWYLRGVPYGAYYRDKATKIASREEFYALKKQMLRELGGGAIEKGGEP